MRDISLLWGVLAQARHDLLRAAMGESPPPRQALTGLENWINELSGLPDDTVSAERMAAAWGNLQLILVDGGVDGTATSADRRGVAWRRVRLAAGEGFQALCARPEWRGLRADLREEVVPWLLDAVNMEYTRRRLRCRYATDHLRALGNRTSGIPHRWTLRLIAELSYPGITPAGWRGRLGVDFTARRARAVICALLEALRPDDTALPLVIGYESRLQADTLAQLAAELATGAGLPVHLCRRDTPIPALRAYLTETLGTNAARPAGLYGRHVAGDGPGTRHFSGHPYEGLRAFLPSGLPLPPARCLAISRRTAELLLDGTEILPHAPGVVTIIDPLEDYRRRNLAAISSSLSDLEGGEASGRDAIHAYWGQRGGYLVIDEMHGAARGYADDLCRMLDIPCEYLACRRASAVRRVGRGATPRRATLATCRRASKSCERNRRR